MEFGLNSILDAVFGPLFYVVEPSKRLFWPFLISAGVLAMATLYVQTKQFDLKRQLAALLNRNYWFNASTRIDYGLVFVNNLIRLLIVVPLLGSHLAATILVGSFLQTQLGDAPTLDVPYVVVGLLFTLIFFVCEDVSRFGLHALLHKVPLLWRIHQVHHSATTLTPFTVHRVHPLEMALYYFRSLVVFAVVGGVFIYLFKSKVHGWEILGVDCLGFLFNALGANLRHSHIRLSFGVFERWFISPLQHQIHHSCLPQHHDKNFGTCLAIWDKLFGSWRPSDIREPLQFGVVRSSR